MSEVERDGARITCTSRGPVERRTTTGMELVTRRPVQLRADGFGDLFAEGGGELARCIRRIARLLGQHADDGRHLRVARDRQLEIESVGVHGLHRNPAEEMVGAPLVRFDLRAQRVHAVEPPLVAHALDERQADAPAVEVA